MINQMVTVIDVVLRISTRWRRWYDEWKLKLFGLVIESGEASWREENQCMGENGMALHVKRGMRSMLSAQWRRKLNQ